MAYQLQPVAANIDSNAYDMCGLLVESILNGSNYRACLDSVCSNAARYPNSGMGIQKLLIAKLDILKPEDSLVQTRFAESLWHITYKANRGDQIITYGSIGDRLRAMAKQNLANNGLQEFLKQYVLAPGSLS